MDRESFNKTTIGADYTNDPQPYSVDMLLEYLHGMIEMRKGEIYGSLDYIKHSQEISATKEILKIQTHGIH